MAFTNLLHCHRCGTPTAADVRFCPACGQRQGVPDPTGGADDPLLARVRASLLNEYDVACEIGRGGMAAVFLAEDLRLPRRVALKVMLPELAYHAAMPQRFVAEARTAAMLDHPNIVPVFHAGEQDGLRYFAMRFIDGCSLEQLQRAHGGLPVDLACHILSEVAAALAYAHAVGVVHRDVKPSNVMLDRAWARAIVTDFGIARIADGQRLTSTGLAIGTPEYMSPEQYSNDHLTGASDQYALGAVAYQLLADRPPFQGSQAEVLVAHLKEPPPALRTLRPEVPLAVEALIARMLAKEPADRWPSLAEVAARFAEHVGASPAALRQRLIALVPPRGPGDALPRTPLSPVPGVSRPDASGPGGASLAVPAAPPPPAPAVVPPPHTPPHTAPLASMLQAKPGLQTTGLTPSGVAPVAPVAPVATSATPVAVAPALQLTGYAPSPGVAPVATEDARAGSAAGAAPSLRKSEVTPRDVIPIRPGADEPPRPEPGAPTAEDEARELPDEEREPSAALEQHRAWLETNAGAAPAPRPRKSLFIGLGVVAAAVAAVLATRVTTDAPGPTEAGGEPDSASIAEATKRKAMEDARLAARRDSIARDSLRVADSTRLADSLAALRRVEVLVSGRRVRSEFALVQGGTLQLGVVVRDGRDSVVRDVGPVVWTSQDSTRVQVTRSGLVRALAGSGTVRVTAQVGADLRASVGVRLSRPTDTATEQRGPAVPPPAPPAVLLSADDAHRLLSAATANLTGEHLDALQRLFAAAPAGAPSADRLIETLRKERDLRVNVESRDFTGGDAPTLKARLELSWRRGKLGGVLKGNRDDGEAHVVAAFERSGGQWHLKSLQLERFRK